MFTVESLRKNGYGVKVSHYRTVDNYGGATTVEIKAPFGTYVGTSLCNYKDQFDKKLGIRIAIGRALKDMGLPTK